MDVRVVRSGGEIFHSDTFLGDEFSDELYHWKYIKRVKGKNGKWIYYYDRSANKLTALEKDVREAEKALDYDFDAFYKNRYEEDMNRAKREIRTNPKGVENVDRWYSDPDIQKATKETYREGEFLRRSLRSAENALRAHQKTISRKIDKVMAKYGTSTVRSLNKAISRGEQIVKKLKRK